MRGGVLTLTDPRTNWGIFACIACVGCGFRGGWTLGQVIPQTTRWSEMTYNVSSGTLNPTMAKSYFTGYPLNGEYISNWPPWRIRHCTLASHLTCPNCYNIMNPHGLCDLPLLFNSLFHDTTLNLARVNFESQHQKSGIYCLLVSVILHQSLHFAGI